MLDSNETAMDLGRHYETSCKGSRLCPHMGALSPLRRILKTYISETPFSKAPCGDTVVAAVVPLIFLSGSGDPARAKSAKSGFKNFLTKGLNLLSDFFVILLNNESLLTRKGNIYHKTESQLRVKQNSSFSKIVTALLKVSDRKRNCRHEK